MNERHAQALRWLGGPRVAERKSWTRYSAGSIYDRERDKAGGRAMQVVMRRGSGMEEQRMLGCVVWS